MNTDNLEKLVSSLVRFPAETPWLEFKHNNYKPEMIGIDISALANSATLYEKNCAYMIWGVDDKTHAILGTSENLQSLKIGNEELESWLRQRLSRNADFEFHNCLIEGKNVGILVIAKAVNQAVLFGKTDYIRIGSYTKSLNDYPSLRGQLWDKIRNCNFEEGMASEDLDLESALRFLDYSLYFDLSNIPQPGSVERIGHYMLQEDIIKEQDNGLYAITNMGALLFAKRLSDFKRLSRKAIRVVQYQGNNKMITLKDAVSDKGYVVGFEGVIQLIEALTPSREIIRESFREKKTAYPIIAIREAVANALIHQDFSVTGTGPVVEIFDKHVEITNSGLPLVDVYRIIDNPPKSRNEKLASLMRRLRICEELGTGWDKIAISCEFYLLPAPKIEIVGASTRVDLYSEVEFSSISPRDKLWGCYLHACVRHVQGQQLTNCSLRERFGLRVSSTSSVSRLIKEAVNHKMIKPLDPATAPRHMKYIPIWA